MAEGITLERLGSKSSRFTRNSNQEIESARITRTRSHLDVEDPDADGFSAPVTLVEEDEDMKPPTKAYQAALLAAGFFMCFQVIGINTVYGVFQEFYTSPSSNIVDAQGSEALVSLVGTIGSGLTWSGGILVNPIIARTENLKMVAFLGVVVMSLGLILASFCTHLWQLFLTQALLYGFGSSAFYFPILTVAPTFFDKHRGFAMGLILAGSGVGGLVIAPVVRYLIDQYGIQWALRILGLWTFALGLPVSMVVKHRYKRGTGMRARKTRLNMGLARRGTFLYQSAGAFLQAAGNLVPVFYMSSYATTVLSTSASTGSTLIAVYNGVNALSRVSMGVLADYVGRQNTLVAGVVLSAITVLALWYDAAGNGLSQFIAFIIFYGVYAGGYNALLPTTITEIYGVENYSSVNGLLYLIRGLGSMMGAPLAGVILGNFNRGRISDESGEGEMAVDILKMKYNKVVIYDGVLLMASGLCVAYVRWLDARDKGRWIWKA